MEYEYAVNRPVGMWKSANEYPDDKPLYVWARPGGTARFNNEDINTRLTLGGESIRGWEALRPVEK